MTSRREDLSTLLIAIGICCVLNSTANAARKAVRNVVFVVSDDLRADVLGCYGHQTCETPNIDRLAKRGVVFERAYCQGTWCAPSRLSFMYSRYKGKGEVNLGELFIRNNRYSARVGKIYHMRVPGDIIDGTNGKDVASSWTERFNMSGQEAHTPGDYACLNLNVFTDRLENRQSTKMPHRMFVTVKTDIDGTEQPDHKAAAKAVQLLRDHKEEPFFLAIGFVRPHYPMVAPREFFDRYPLQRIELPAVPTDDLEDIPKLGLVGTTSLNNAIGKFPENQKRMWAGYYAAVTFMDQQLGKVLDELDRLGLMDSTAIVFASDHGYHLGEHHHWQKANLHENVIRVPLIVSSPGMPSGRSNSIVELVDVFPTLAELAGIDIPVDVDGVSLLPILRRHSATVKDAALSFSRVGVSLRTSKWHYIRYKDDTTELYDMDDDPNEFRNLATKPEFLSDATRLNRQLNELMVEHSISLPQ